MKPSDFFLKAAGALKLDARVVLDDKWSSRTNDYRKSIRHQLVKDLLAVGESENATWTDLDRVPVAEDWAISITHCKNLGGYILAQGDIGLGVDVELSHRMTEENLLRVSTQQEVDDAPSAAHLWVAKEAAYKSIFGFDQPVTVGPVILENWQEDESCFWHFTFRQDVRGVAWVDSQYALAIAVSSRNA